MRQFKTKVKHICGQCNLTFPTEEAYLKHVCPASDASPKTKVTSLSEKKILDAVRTARRGKRP